MHIFPLLCNVIIYTLFILGIAIISEWIVSDDLTHKELFDNSKDDNEENKFSEYQNYKEIYKIPKTEEDYLISEVNKRLESQYSNFKLIPKQVTWKDPIVETPIKLPYHDDFIIDNKYSYIPNKKDYSTDSYNITGINNYSNDTFFSLLE